jgi:uncharacterized protein (UPF0332 family)
MNKNILIKAERSLNAAKELNNKNYPEFATSRCYYSMFYVEWKKTIRNIF